jgi:hypothetical protein
MYRSYRLTHKILTQRVVLLEATSDYWRSPFCLLEDDLNVILVNAAHAKGVPGRKTDVADAAWLCQLGECGLLKASFVPPELIREVRDLTRYRATLAAERTRGRLGWPHQAVPTNTGAAASSRHTGLRHTRPEVDSPLFSDQNRKRSRTDVG